MILALALALGWMLISTEESSAATCLYEGGNQGSWHEPLHWDCERVPGAGDTAVVPEFTEVSVAADAAPGAVHLGGPASILTFSGGATLATGTLDAASATLQGDGTVTVAGAFHKGGVPGADTMFVSDTVDLVLNGDSVMDGGVISVCQAGDPPSDPTLHINADFTVAEGANSFSFFNCSSSGARIRVGPAGHLIKEAGGQMTSDTAIDNDGTITVQTGTLLLKGGTANALGATSDGDYLADDGAELEFQGGSPPVLGATGRYGGAGTIHLNTLGMDALAGSVIDPAVLQISGFLRLRGTAPVTLPDLELTNGTIDSDRPIAVGDMDVTGGTLQRDFTLTVQPGGSFTKTTGLTFFVTNNGAFGSADLVLDADASLEEGQICVSRTGTDPDLPGLHINQDFTIESTAPAGAFQCGPQFDTLIHLNGPDGHLSRVGPGTTNFNDLDLAGGTLSVASGQTFAFPNTYAQSAGVTEIASGGTLQAAPTLTGGVLRGGGQVSGNVTNTSGTVRPGTSPGTLTVTGNYAQGAAGVLVVDVAGTARGTQYDHLSVGGAAALDGTLAVVQAGGFAPAPTDAFGFLTSASRTGTFATLVGAQLPGGKRYGLDYPGAPDFGARLLGPADLVITDCDDPALATITEVTGDLIVDGLADCDALELPSLTEVAGDLILTDLPSVTAVALNSLDTAGDLSILDLPSAETVALNSLDTAGDLSILDLPSADTIALNSLDTAGDLTIIDNGAGEVILGELESAAGDVTIESTGDETFALGDGSPAGDLDLDLVGYEAVTGATAGGTTTIENDHPEGLMRAELPSGAFTSPVGFSITRVDPATLPPDGDVDPVVAHQFNFAVPTLNSAARLTFEVRLAGLDAATREDLLTALDSGTATLATKGDAPGGTYRAFPLCAGGAAPSADGCVTVTRLDGVVRFSGVVGHFSTWAVAIAAPPRSNPPPPLSPSPPTSNAPFPSTASNAFRFGKVRLNRRKRTASLAVRVPGPGSLSLRGKGIKRQRKAVRAAGTVRLTVRPTGKAKRKLARTGKLTVKVAVTYRPSGGSPATKTKKIRLRRARRP